MSTLQLSDHSIDDGIESYSFPSTAHPKERHTITRIDQEPWKVHPACIQGDLSVDQALLFIAELQDLTAACARLNDAPVSM